MGEGDLFNSRGSGETVEQGDEIGLKKAEEEPSFTCILFSPGSFGFLVLVGVEDLEEEKVGVAVEVIGVDRTNFLFFKPFFLVFSSPSSWKNLSLIAPFIWFLELPETSGNSR